MSEMGIGIEAEDTHAMRNCWAGSGGRLQLAVAPDGTIVVVWS